MADPEKPWDFDRWFEAQHGKRPSKIQTELLRDRVQSNRIGFAASEMELQALEQWESRRTSALYAWQIRDEDKKGGTRG